MNGFMQTSFFFGYMACICYGFFLMLGTVGFRASLFFVRHIYRSIKCEQCLPEMMDGFPSSRVRLASNYHSWTEEDRVVQQHSQDRLYYFNVVLHDVERLFQFCTRTEIFMFFQQQIILKNMIFLFIVPNLFLQLRVVKLSNRLSSCSRLPSMKLQYTSLGLMLI